LLDDKIFIAARIHSSRQLTDFYLLALAAKYGGMLATFDQGIPISAVRIAGAKNLCVL
jgi:predicted nucleic acid-binding protein